MSRPLHVIFGAGQVGANLARLLVSRGHRVRVVRRSPAPVAPEVEVVAGDATDATFAVRAAAGAAVVYHCMNPSAYTAEAWEAEFPKQGEAVIAAALATGARLVVLDNLYAYGVSDEARTPATPLRADGPKGRVRIAWHERLFEAAERDGLRFVVGRAGDFFGPGSQENSLLSTKALGGLATGGRVLLIGDADAVHAFSFVPDVVAGLAALGEAAEAGAGTAGEPIEGRVWHLPVVEIAPREAVREVATALGVPARTLALPAWLLRLLAPVVPLFGQLRETLYQWDRPFRVDDTAFRARFPGLATERGAAFGRIAEQIRAAA